MQLSGDMDRDIYLWDTGEIGQFSIGDIEIFCHLCVDNWIWNNVLVQISHIRQYWFTLSVMPLVPEFRGTSVFTLRVGEAVYLYIRHICI